MSKDHDGDNVDTRHHGHHVGGIDSGMEKEKEETTVCRRTLFLSRAAIRALNGRGGGVEKKGHCGRCEVETRECLRYLTCVGW